MGRVRVATELWEGPDPRAWAMCIMAILIFIFFGRPAGFLRTGENIKCADGAMDVSSTTPLCRSSDSSGSLFHLLPAASWVQGQ